MHEKGFTHVLLIVAVFAVGTVFLLSQIPQSSLRQAVLGEEKDREEDRNEPREEDRSEGEREEGGLKEENRNDDDNGRPEDENEEHGRDEEERRDDTPNIQEFETEVENEDGEKIKTKVEDDGRVKLTIEDGDLKYKYIFRDGKVIATVENEEGDEVEVEDADFDDIAAEFENEIEAEFDAITDLDVAFDSATDTVVATTPVGDQPIAVSPDTAVQTAIRTQTIDEERSVTLQFIDDELVYQVEGAITQNLLGLFPVEIINSTTISAQTGGVIDTQISLLSQIIGLLSF